MTIGASNSFAPGASRGLRAHTAEDIVTVRGRRRSGAIREVGRRAKPVVKTSARRAGSEGGTLSRLALDDYRCLDAVIPSVSLMPNVGHSTVGPC